MFSLTVVVQIPKWKRLLTSCQSASVREEFLILARDLLCIRIAGCLGIDKVMVSDCADRLAERSLTALAFARGLFASFELSLLFECRKFFYSLSSHLCSHKRFVVRKERRILCEKFFEPHYLSYYFKSLQDRQYFI